MARYTLHLNEILEDFWKSKNPGQPYRIDDLIQLGVETLFEPYIIFEESYRQILNEKIVRHFFTNEIGFETYWLWRFELNTRLKEIMPYFNDLYRATVNGIDPFKDTDYWRKNKGSGNEKIDGEGHKGIDSTKSAASQDSGTDSTHSNSNSEGTTTDTEVKEKAFTAGVVNTKVETYTSDSKDTKTKKGTDNTNAQATPSLTLSSDTPQGSIEGVTAGKYLSNVTQVRTDGSGDTTVTYDTVEDTSGRPSNKNTVDTPEGTEKTVDKTLSGNVHVIENESNDTTVKYGKKNDLKETAGTLEDTTNTSNKDRWDVFAEHVFGKMNNSRTYYETLADLKDKILNIDLMVIDALEDLFMLLWL